jgi:hypothetical protein
MMFEFTWHYDGGDPSLLLLERLLARRMHRLALPLPLVVDIGNQEEDFVGLASAQNPSLVITGRDFRTDGFDAMDPHGFRNGTVGFAVLLGALEHFGLGYYGDPVADFGDQYAMLNISNWVPSGGYVFVDVPWNPDRHFVSDNKPWRCDTSIATRIADARFFDVVDTLYAGAHEPYQVYDAAPSSYSFPFDYCAMLLRRK